MYLNFLENKGEKNSRHYLLTDPRIIENIKELYKNVKQKISQPTQIFLRKVDKVVVRTQVCEVGSCSSSLVSGSSSAEFNLRTKLSIKTFSGLMSFVASSQLLHRHASY